MGLRSTFIANLKKYRHIKNISQMKIAELCETSASYIGEIEIGRKFPSVEMIERLAEALEISPHLLFTDGQEESVPYKKYQTLIQKAESLSQPQLQAIENLMDLM